MRHVLIVANQTLIGSHLHERVEHILAVDPDTRFHIVVPATGANGPDPVRALSGARRRLSQGFEALDDLGAQVTGEIGPAHPVVAVELAIDRLSPDLIILSTLPAGASRWLHLDLPHRLKRRFGVPVEHISAQTQTVERQGNFEPPVLHAPDDTVHVLLAEENQHDVDVITLALAEAGTRNQLRVAHDGANALAFIRSVGASEIDLVLFDLKLPVVSGFDLLAEVRNEDEFDKVMMVALTTEDAAEDRARAYDLGADAFVTKRPDYSQMAHVIDDLLAEVAG